MMSNLKVLWMQIKESIIFVSLIPHYFLGKYNSSNASYFFLLVLHSPSNSRGIRFRALHIMIRRATNIIMLHEAAHLHGKFHLIISNVIQYELRNYTRSQDTDV